MKKIILSGLVAMMAVTFMACESKTTVIREVPAAPQADPAVKIKINDGSGSGVDVNVPTK